MSLSIKEIIPIKTSTVFYFFKFTEHDAKSAYIPESLTEISLKLSTAIR